MQIYLQSVKSDANYKALTTPVTHLMGKLRKLASALSSGGPPLSTGSGQIAKTRQKLDWKLTNFESGGQAMQWPETEVMLTCWNLLGKTREITLGKLIFGGFEPFETCVSFYASRQINWDETELGAKFKTSYFLPVNLKECSVKFYLTFWITIKSKDETSVHSLR